MFSLIKIMVNAPKVRKTSYFFFFLFYVVIYGDFSLAWLALKRNIRRENLVY